MKPFNYDHLCDLALFFFGLSLCESYSVNHVRGRAQTNNSLLLNRAYWITGTTIQAAACIYQTGMNEGSVGCRMSPSRHFAVVFSKTQKTEMQQTTKEESEVDRERESFIRHHSCQQQHLCM